MGEWCESREMGHTNCVHRLAWEMLMEHISTLAREMLTKEYGQAGIKPACDTREALENHPKIVQKKLLTSEKNHANIAPVPAMDLLAQPLST